MARRFQSQVVFITGASSGIGAALARAFHAEGAKVALAARRREKLEALAAELGADHAIALTCDVTDRASLDAAVAETVRTFGGIDVAIANAGFGVSGPLSQLTTGDYRKQFDTNVFGLIDTIYATLPALQDRRGRLVLISSVLGRFGRPMMSAYAASKFAVNGLAESLYHELAGDGVSVICINPGLVESEFRFKDNEGQIRDGAADPARQWLVVPAARAARAMVNAIYRRRPEVTITGHGKLAVWANRHFPRTFRMLIRAMTRGRTSAY